MEEVQFIQPHTLEWDEARLGRLTSSEIHKIFTKPQNKSERFAEGAKTYIYEKIAEHLTRECKKVPETEAILRGLAEEQYARERYIQITGHKVTDSCFIAYNSIFGGTNDGNIIIEKKHKGIIEIKCPDSKKFVEICACQSAEELGKIDKQYKHQPQANIFISGAEFCDFVAYDDRVRIPELQLKIIRIYPDMEWQKDFKLLIGDVAEMMNDELTKILNTPENNLQFKATKIDKSKLDTLTDTLNQLSA